MFACTKLFAVELSVFKGVAGWGWPKARREIPQAIASCALPYTPPVPASAAAPITLRRVLHRVRMAPLGLGEGFASGGGG